MKNSIVDTVIGRDILQISRVKSPALFRQCFDLACSYGGKRLATISFWDNCKTKAMLS